MKKKRYYIKLSNTIGSTKFYMHLTPEEYELINLVGKNSEIRATAYFNPVLKITETSGK